MTGSQKLYVLAGVLLGGLGLALPFRHLAPRQDFVSEDEPTRGTARASQHLSLAIEAGNDGDLPSPRGRTPYFSDGQTGIREPARHEPPVLRNSPDFYEPRPDDPLPRIGSHYEPLLQRQPFRTVTPRSLPSEGPSDSLESQRQPWPAGDDEGRVAEPPRSLSEEATHDSVPVARVERFEVRPTDDDRRASVPTAQEFAIAALERNGNDFSPTFGGDPSEVRSGPYAGSDDSPRRPMPGDQVGGESPLGMRPSSQPPNPEANGAEAGRQHESNWTGSPRLRGWRETQIARAGDDTHSRNGRPAPYARYRTYRLRDGDTLPGLALRFLGAEERYPEILESNRDVLRDPQVLPLGVEIRIPY